MTENTAEKKLLYPQTEVENWPQYVWRVFAKVLSLFIFGTGSVLLTIICFPVCKLVFHPKIKFRYHTRHLVYILFGVFLKFMWLIGLIKIKTNKPGYLKNLKSAIVVANHPAYLDSPVMIGQFPHTSIVAKASLSKGNVMSAIIKELYMPNSMSYEEMKALAKEDLQYGNTIVMFPEGTRSTKYGQNKYKKGFARIALAAGCPVIPVYIGGTEKLGLGKGDKIFQCNHSSRYVFDLQIKDPVYPEEFKDLPEAIAAKRMTQKIREALDDEANAIYRY